MLAATYMLLRITWGQDFVLYLHELLWSMFYIAYHIVGNTL